MGPGDQPFKFIHLERGLFLIGTNVPRPAMALAACTVLCTYYMPGLGLKAYLHHVTLLNPLTHKELHEAPVRIL